LQLSADFGGFISNPTAWSLILLVFIQAAGAVPIDVQAMQIDLL
jgi:hypothetical protein